MCANRVAVAVDAGSVPVIGTTTARMAVPQSRAPMYLAQVFLESLTSRPPFGVLTGIGKKTDFGVFFIF